MTRGEVKTAGAVVKELLLQNLESLRDVIRAVMQEVCSTEPQQSRPAACGQLR